MEVLPIVEIVAFAGAFVVFIVIFIVVVCCYRAKSQNDDVAWLAIASGDYAQARVKIEATSTHQCPECQLALAYVCARLDDRQACLSVLKNFYTESDRSDAFSTCFDSLLSYLEGGMSGHPESSRYRQLADDTFAQAEAPTPDDLDEDAQIDSLNERLDAALICVLAHCMLALLGEDKGRDASALRVDPETALFPWLVSIYESRPAQGE